MTVAGVERVSPFGPAGVDAFDDDVDDDRGQYDQPDDELLVVAAETELARRARPQYKHVYTVAQHPHNSPADQHSEYGALSAHERTAAEHARCCPGSADERNFRKTCTISGRHEARART
jgi:hypothetical protein